jgi:hypothetical protein
VTGPDPGCGTRRVDARAHSALDHRIARLAWRGRTAPAPESSGIRGSSVWRCRRRVWRDELPPPSCELSHQIGGSAAMFLDHPRRAQEAPVPRTTALNNPPCCRNTSTGCLADAGTLAHPRRWRRTRARRTPERRGELGGRASWRRTNGESVSSEISITDGSNISEPVAPSSPLFAARTQKARWPLRAGW